MFQALLLGLVLLLAACGGEKRTALTANNEYFNTFYKNQEHISPIGNVVAQRQSPELLERNYQYFTEKYHTSKNSYEEDQKYILFLVKNENIKQIKNVTVENLPESNKHYVLNVAEYGGHRDINKEKYLTIEYAMFLNDAKLAKQFRESKGDPIIHPYVYTDVASVKKRIVIGDEYSSWSSICETQDVC